MESQQGGSYDLGAVPPTAAAGDRLGDRVAYADGGPPRRRSTDPGIAVGENVLTVRDLVQWGPIVTGVVSGLVVLVLLTVLGLAVGASAFKPESDLQDWGTQAGVWGGTSALIAFLVGG
jgi:hypothetical protein